MKKKLCIICAIAALQIAAMQLSAQQTNEDLLAGIENEKPEKEFVKYAFKSPRVINSHSIEFLNPGTMDFRILHRFGLLNQGYKNFFGLDQASMRLGFDFGLKRNLMAGIGRSTLKKEVDAYVKYAPVMQSTGPHSSPVTIALVQGITVDGLPWPNPSRKNYFSSRTAYYFQTIIGRKINEKLTLQIAPTVVHKNFVQLRTDENTIIAAGLAGRYKFTKRMAFTWDYSYVLTALPQGYYNPLSLGIDIETGGHVFQLHFSNASGMNERAFITETTDKWARRQVRWGFNLSRVFQIKKK